LISVARPTNRPAGRDYLLGLVFRREKQRYRPAATVRITVFWLVVAISLKKAAFSARAFAAWHCRSSTAGKDTTVMQKLGMKPADLRSSAKLEDCTSRASLLSASDRAAQNRSKPHRKEARKQGRREQSF